MMCQLAQAGVGLGANSVLMKFSRGYEHDADLNGARMMNSAGYNPIELANFFQKLEATLGTAAEPRGLALWMASHPATGNRIQYVQQDISFYPKQDYKAGSGNFARVKQLVASIPPAKLKPAALLSQVQGNPRSDVPQGFKDFATKGFAVAFPSSWQAGQAQQGGSIYLVPQGGAAKDQSGGVELLAGAMVDYYVPERGPETTRLDSTTNDFVASLRKGDTNLRAERSSGATVGGKPALLTKLTTKTSTQMDQVIYLYTTVRQAGLWYLVEAATPDQVAQLDPVFKQMNQTIVFPNDVP
jgi:hypothetical protein